MVSPFRGSCSLVRPLCVLSDPLVPSPPHLSFVFDLTNPAHPTTTYVYMHMLHDGGAFLFSLSLPSAAAPSRAPFSLCVPWLCRPSFLLPRPVPIQKIHTHVTNGGPRGKAREERHAALRLACSPSSFPPPPLPPAPRWLLARSPNLLLLPSSLSLLILLSCGY